MACAAGSSIECTICRNGFEEPKLLPCAHLVCRTCVVTWLEIDDYQNRCPFCRTPIFPESEDFDEDTCDLASQVDALPSNLAIAMVLESAKTLSSDHKCKCCKNKEASLFCLHCNIKMCNTCAKLHDTFPLHQDHVTEKLHDLTAEQLAAKHQMLCEDHKNKPLVLYCTDHEKLVCAECVSTSHSKCAELKGIVDMIPVAREQIKTLIDKIGIKGAAVTAKIKELDSDMTNSPDEFEAMRSQVKAVFDDLMSSLEVHRLELYDEIDELKDTYLEKRRDIKILNENLERALSANKATAEELLASAPDGALLAMLGKLKQRLEGLEAQQVPGDPLCPSGRVLLSTAAVDLTKKAIAALAVVNEYYGDEIYDDWDLWCDNCRPEGTFRFNVDVSELVVGELMESPSYMIQNLPWKILVGKCHKGEFLGVYVRCNDDSMSTQWSCQAAAELRLLTASPGGKPECYDLNELFSPDTSLAWGISRLISWNDLMDPGKAYVEDNKITVEVTIKADAPQGV